MSGIIAARAQPTAAEVDRIAAVGDPVIRNLQITQRYYELSLVLAGRLRSNANWCTFAAWASRQAGQTIRKEDIARTLEGALTTAPSTRRAAEEVVAHSLAAGSGRSAGEIRGSVWDVLDPAGALDNASEAVARGNKKVFQEIGREFARFHAQCLSDRAVDGANIARFCAELRPGDPPDGQQYLRQAFTRYYQAFFESDPKARTELLCLANVEIGLHEQTRLQPEIAEALGAAVVEPREFTRRLVAAVFPYRGWLARARLFVRRLFSGPTLLDTAGAALVEEARREVRRFITGHFLTLGLANGARLRLGEDLRARCPAALAQVRNADLLALLRRIDPTPNSLRESGALDWADLPERLHFICDFFRCYQQMPELFAPPFTPEQVAALKLGRCPAGDL